MSLLFPVQRDAHSAGFFDAAADGTLAVRRCSSGHFLPVAHGWFGENLRCSTCGSEEIEWVLSSGEPKLVSWTGTYGRDGALQTIAGIVELPEGPWIQALIDAPDESELRAELPLQVSFTSSGEGGEIVPVFAPS